MGEGEGVVRRLREVTRMSRPFAAVAILLLFAAAALGQTNITGDITTSQTWGPSGSPYIIQADVEIVNDSTLTIQSGFMGGVTVAFEGNYYLRTDWGSAIVAQGNSTHRVVFTSNSGTPTPNDWLWVTANGPGASSFEYCTFEFAQMGLRLSATPANASHCVMRNCGNIGLLISASSPTVLYCDMYDCHDGVMLNNVGGYTAEPVINYCNIYDNENYNLIVFDFPPPAVVVDCQNNWWGTDVDAEIAAKIRDSTDNPEVYATIDYDPWLHEQPVERATWGSIKALFAE